jgi:predicted transcriptional regulator
MTHELLADDMPTLRIITLRRIVARRAAPLVFDSRTTIATIDDAFQRSSTTFAALVDSAGVLRGTLCIADLADIDRNASADAVMVTNAPIVRPEDDIDEAHLEMTAHGADRVLVVESSGVLLGVLTERDLIRGRRAA